MNTRQALFWSMPDRTRENWAVMRPGLHTEVFLFQVEPLVEDHSIIWIKEETQLSDQRSHFFQDTNYVLRGASTTCRKS